MRLELIKPSASLNKAFRKTSLKRDQIELFKANLKRLFERINDQESEEHLKNIISDFLKDTWYKNLNEINTKGRADLVIHNGKSSSDTVGVIFEVKRQANKAEMISADKPNEKALHELLNYYLDERFIRNNKEIKHLIVTNIDEWFIFDGADFERFFFENPKLTKQYKDWHDGLSGVKLNDWFYQEIARPFIEKELPGLKCTWFNLRNFETIIRNNNKPDDIKLIDLYKTLSPEHLLKKAFANDSNTLNKEFYNELLHIIGLEETKEGSKKLIRRTRAETRNDGSLLENTINILKIRNKLSAVENLKQYGETEDEQLFSVGLELCLTWLNRVLFLKLLEGQLVRYNQGKKEFAFLNCNRIKDFDELNELFFEVLAIPSGQRSGSVAEKFGNLPYLNSSLFEETGLEQRTIVITELKGRLEIPIHSSTVLKESTGKRITGKRNTLQYLFEFLDAFDFASDNSAEIQEQNKTLINASVLGLIFEKINGYKDGSFFTPGFITMYMCRETIRRAVIQKFNEKYHWECADITDLYNKIEKISLPEANETINSLKICDPAVGSGHFLVSALNEIISIKSDLAVLTDKEGKRLRGYNVTIENDELILTQEDEIFSYNYKDPESQRIQETLFHEKQIIIENCLFGVDINPKSAMICRLRLWIELLKNSYYTSASKFTELETLPNIDINIKCGNSLISRYSLDSDMKRALEKSKWNIGSYRLAVMTYRNAGSKEEKREMEKLIETIKNDFESEVAANDKRVLSLKKLNGELFTLTNQTSLFEKSKKEKEEWNKKVNELTAKIKKLENELEEIKKNKIYENAFEWRFEFPEVLNDDGDFVGFDVVIGNPPYGVNFSSYEKVIFLNQYLAADDIYTLFMEKGLDISKNTGNLSFIIPIFWLTGDNYLSTRTLLQKKAHLEIGITLPYNIFADAYVDTGIFMFSKNMKSILSNVYEFNPKDIIDLNTLNSLSFNLLGSDEWGSSRDFKIIFNPVSRSLTNKLVKLDKKISDITDSIRGILADIEDYSDTQVDIDYKPIFIGKLGRYSQDDVFQFVKYGENLKEKPSSYQFFEGERLLIRRIVNRQFRIMATIAMDPFVNKKDIYVFKPNSTEYSCKYLLAIINSKLISFIKTKGSTSAKKDDFTQLTLNDIRQLGVPSPSHQQKFIIEDLVDRILNAKKSNPNAETSEQEKKIDQLVYELYGLTEEEIKIVEETT